MAFTRDHILAVSPAVFVLRCIQLALAVVILGLAAYGITFLSFDAINLTLFSALATIILTIYYLVATTSLVAAYNYWAILGLDIFAIVFWLISFAYLGYDVGSISIVTYSYSNCDYYYAGYCYKRDLNVTKRATTNIYTYRNAMAAAAGLGGLEFVLFIITLIFTAIAIHRHRAAGGHCVAHNPDAPVSVAAPVAMEEQKSAAVYEQPQQQYQQVPMDGAVYPQQPMQGQQVYQQPQQGQQVYHQQQTMPQQVYQQPQEQVYQQQPVQGQQVYEQQPIHHQPQQQVPQQVYQQPQQVYEQVSPQTATQPTYQHQPAVHGQELPTA